MSKINVKYISFFIVSALLVLLVRCRDESAPVEVPPDNESSNSKFISATPVNEISLQALKIFTKSIGQEELTDRLRYGIKTFKLVYETTYKGTPIQASGLMFIPDSLTEEAPLLSLQHGTTFLKSEAPSAAGQFTGMEFFASAGYITLMPDFIGYGASAELFHPYYDKEHSAFTVIHMVESAKEFLAKENIPFNDQLFLAGYSEGGYVTMAATNEIETNSSLDLSVTAVASGAGGYDLTEMLETVTTTSYYSYPSYLAFVLISYNHMYGWEKPLTYFFSEKYADVLSTHMNGEYSGGFINSKLTTDMNELFNPEFFERLKSPEGELELKQALLNNSITGWSTQTPIRLYHGTKDEIIPHENSEVTLDNFMASGSNNVRLILIPEGTHGSSFLPMLVSFVPWFEDMK